MKTIKIITVLLFSVVSFSQTVPDSLNTNPQNQQNAAQRILNGNITSGVTVGGYAQIDYNQPEGKNGKLDVHRLVMLFGYKFNEKTQFITEIEFEHVKEVYIEQAFLQYSLSDNVNMRAGLMLVPMGIINEYHEPTTYNGVERPSMDKSIVPTTWREIGFGVSGRLDNTSLRYQAYIMNGFKSVNETKKGFLGGKNGLRSGRQKGAESIIHSPTFSAKLDHYGIPGLRLGLSGYFGRTQPDEKVKDVDGAHVGVAMYGFDARYSYQRFTARGQFIHTNITDAKAYNDLTGKDLGSTLQGWYLEAAYNLLPQTKKQQLFAFARYEDFNTHTKTDGIEKNLSYDRDELTLGLSYKLAPGAVVKVDYQIRNNAVKNSKVENILNFGVGVWF